MAEFEVEKKDICMGIKILQFLMDSCPPGTAPDATIVGSVMGLVSALVQSSGVCCKASDWPLKKFGKLI